MIHLFVMNDVYLDYDTKSILCALKSIIWCGQKILISKYYTIAEIMVIMIKTNILFLTLSWKCHIYIVWSLLCVLGHMFRPMIKYFYSEDKDKIIQFCSGHKYRPAIFLTSPSVLICHNSFWKKKVIRVFQKLYFIIIIVIIDFVSSAGEKNRRTRGLLC